MQCWQTKPTPPASPAGCCNTAGIKVVIPLKSDQIAARKRKASKGGRPPGLGSQMYRERNVVERSFALIKQWRGLATRYDCEDERVPPRTAV